MSCESPLRCRHRGCQGRWKELFSIVNGQVGWQEEGGRNLLSQIMLYGTRSDFHLALCLGMFWVLMKKRTDGFFDWNSSKRCYEPTESKWIRSLSLLRNERQHKQHMIEYVRMSTNSGTETTSVLSDYLPVRYIYIFLGPHQSFLWLWATRTAKKILRCI